MSVVRVVHLKPSRDLCGTTEAQFADLLVRLAPLAEERKAALADRPDRKRARGAGRRPFPFWLRLLVALTHLKQGTTVRATAAVFDIHERSVRRYRDEVEALLVTHGFQPPGDAAAIRSLDDLASYLETLEADVVLVDGTEVRRSSPYEWAAQKAAWSGKTKDHVVKATVVADQGRRPLWVEANPSGEGRTHDITMLRAQTGLLAVLVAAVMAGTMVMVDAGYRRLDRDLGPDGVITPIHKPRYQQMNPHDRAYNQQLSSARMPVEHAIGRMKWWRALHYWRRPPTTFDRTAKAIGVLATLT